MNQNRNLKEDEIIVEIQCSPENKNIETLIDYIYHYHRDYQKKVIVLGEDNTFLEIKYEDIILFYSDKKSNYCQTIEKSYKVKSRLYELEKMNNSFIRISKSCIVNMKHVEKFDISETGKIVVILDNHQEEIVSRRRTRDIMRYLEDRRI